MTRSSDSSERDSPARTRITTVPLVGEIGLVLALFAILIVHHLHVVSVTSERTTVWAGAFSRDSDRVAIASEVGNAVFDLERGEVEFTIGGQVSALTYSHDGSILAVGGFDGDVRLLDSSTGCEIHTLEGLTARVGRVRFSADDQKLVAIGHDDRFAVWDVPSGRRICLVEAGEKHSYAVDFVDGDTHVVTGGGSGNNFVGGSAEDYTGHSYGDRKTHSFKVWNLKTGSLTRTWEGPEHCFVEDIAVTKDGRKLVAGLSIPTLRIWDISIEKEVAVFRAQAHDGLILSGDEQRLLALHYGGVDVCDVRSGKVRTLEVAGAVEAATFTDDGTVLTVDEFGYLTHWNPDSGERISRSDGYTLRTRPLNFAILVVALVWLVAWILLHATTGLSVVQAPAALLLPCFAGLFLGAGFILAQAAFQLWAESSSMKLHGRFFLLFGIAAMLGLAAFVWSRGSEQRRPVSMQACLLVGLSGVAYHGHGLIHAMASAG